MSERNLTAETLQRADLYASAQTATSQTVDALAFANDLIAGKWQPITADEWRLALALLNLHEAVVENAETNALTFRLARLVGLRED